MRGQIWSSEFKRCAKTCDNARWFRFYRTPRVGMSLLSRRRFLQTTTGAMAGALPRAATAEVYPARSIRLVIPYAAGGSGDQIGQPWAEKVTSLLGPIYEENIGGAGGALGCAAVAQSAPDGYSLLLGNISTKVIIPLTSASPPTIPSATFRRSIV